MSSSRAFEFSSELPDYDDENYTQLERSISYRCLECGQCLEFVSDYQVRCINFECSAYGIKYDAD